MKEKKAEKPECALCGDTEDVQWIPREQRYRCTKGWACNRRLGIDGTQNGSLHVPTAVNMTGKWP
ncbi:MAG: hypothetical protein R3B71_02655 [Candidatus Gracilibacteria bacterium]